MTQQAAYNIAFLLSQALGVFAVYMLMKAFFEKRNVKKAAEIISYAGYYILTVSVYFLINIPLVNFAVTVVSYFLLTFLYSSSIKKKAFVSLTIFVFGICTEMLAVTLTGYINFPIDKTIDYNSIFGVVATNASLFIVSMIVNGFKNIKQDSALPKSFWAYLLVVPALSLYVLVMFFRSENLSSFEIGTSIAAILLINFTVFFLIDGIARLYREKQESALIKQQNEYYVNQLRANESLYQASRDLRHNIKNHLITVNSYIENGSGEEAKKYLAEIIDNYRNKTEIIHTGYPEIDGLLNYKLQPAAESGIKVNIKASISPRLNFSSFDLTVILGNLLDNALEAASLVKENPFIDLGMTCSKGMMIIKISNPYKNTLKIENGKIATLKEDKINHGIGLKSVGEILKKYNGMMKIDTNDNIFTVTAALYPN